MKDQMKTLRKKLILVGGGHAHVGFIRQYHESPVKDLEVILISSSKYQYYSGMASGFIEGFYDKAAITFDLEDLCEKSGISFLEGTVTAVDVDQKTVKLDDGSVMSFDCISFDTGSRISGHAYGMRTDKVVPIKPLTSVEKIRDAFESRIVPGDRMIVVGSGASGVEISLAMKALSKKLEKPVRLQIIGRGDTLMKGYSRSMKASALKAVRKAGIELCLGKEVKDVKDGLLETASGDVFEFDYLVWAAGSESDPLYRASDLAVDAKGYMLVNTYLQSVSHPFVFGAGDCIAFKDYDYVKKVGVYAVREAPYLYNNLLNYLKGEALEAYVPQKRYLAIVSAGNRKGILQYGHFTMCNRFSWRLKRRIDVGFMEKHKF